MGTTLEEAEAPTAEAPAAAEAEVMTETDVRKSEAAPEALSLPQIDGQGIDRIDVNFSGSIRLDRSDPADVALFKRLALGKEVDLRVVGIAAGKDARISYDEDGYPGETTARAKVKVTTLYRPISDDGAMARVGSDQTEFVEE